MKLWPSYSTCEIFTLRPLPHSSLQSRASDWNTCIATGACHWPDALASEH